MVKAPFHQESGLIPPIESGDRLNRYEFERRYNAKLSLKKAELIEGVVYLPATLRFRSHAELQEGLASGEHKRFVKQLT